MTNKERLQYAKENYPVGTKVKCAYDNKKYTVEEEDFFENSGDIWESDNLCLYEKCEDKWAEIISNPDVNNINVANMTHKKAIELLECILIDYCGEDVDAIQYAINQMKQCEVFDKPVEMEICNQSDFRDIHIAKVYAKTFAGYVVYDAELFEWQIWEYARPIKKNPLSFRAWYFQEKGSNSTIMVHDVEDEFNEYTEYLKKFNK